jgi:hypothetical protein
MTRGFLGRYAGTLLPLAAGLVAIVLGWAVLADGAVVREHPWAAAVIGGTAWLLTAAVWLRCRGWRATAIHAVTWIAPAAVLAAPATAGWLSADGLVLWAPAITVLADSLWLATEPGGRSGVSSRAGAPCDPGRPGPGR